MKSHGIGMQIQIRLVDLSHLAGFLIQDDGPDGCHVYCMAREYVVGVGGHMLDSAIVKFQETVLPDDGNKSKQALFHCICGYATAKLYKVGPN